MYRFRKAGSTEYVRAAAYALFCALCADLFLTPGVANAAVRRIEIKEHRLISSHPDHGIYFYASGRSELSVLKQHPSNRVIAGLQRAPQSTGGEVRVEVDFAVLHRLDQPPSRLLVEMSDRGRKFLLPWLNDAVTHAPSPALNSPRMLADLGNRFVFDRGFAVLWIAWDATSADGEDTLQIRVPTVEGLRQRIREEFIPGIRGPMGHTVSLTYPAATVDGATLLRFAIGGAEVVQRGEPGGYRFLNARAVRLPTAPFGTRFALMYEAEKPSVTGLGFAAVRDLAAAFRYCDAALSTLTPLCEGGFSSTVALGISQSARFLHDFIRLGFNRDEAGREVFEGALIHAAGSGGVFANELFAQPFRNRTQREDHAYPESRFPFAYRRLRDPRTGRRSGILRHDGFDPKVLEVITSTDYWQKQASLLHTDPTGRRDIQSGSNVRLYLASGTAHLGRAGVSDAQLPCVYPPNLHSPAPLLRALLVAMKQWIEDETRPPESQIPRIDEGTLVRRSALNRKGLLNIPAEVNPTGNIGSWVTAEPHRLHGRPAATYVPLVPQVDDFGNELAGVKLPDIAAPRGAHLGWNLYSLAGLRTVMCDLHGGFLPFGDPQLRALYPEDADYRASIRRSAQALQDARFLLPEDAAVFIEQSLSVLHLRDPGANLFD